MFVAVQKSKNAGIKSVGTSRTQVRAYLTPYTATTTLRAQGGPTPVGTYPRGTATRTWWLP